MAKNKLAYFLFYSSPYSSKRSFPSVAVCVRLWLKLLRVFSVVSVGSSESKLSRREALQGWDKRARGTEISFALTTKLIYPKISII
jgi:hypothetical protein